MKFTVKDRKELHDLIQTRWSGIYSEWKTNGEKNLPEKTLNYMDFLQRLHNKVDSLG